MDDLSGLQDTQQLQWALQGDFEVVARYGEEHPDVLVGVWWENEPTVRIVLAVTGDVGGHEAALRPGLQHPDRLVVQGKEHSRAELRRIREEIHRAIQEREVATDRRILQSVGDSGGVVSVRLQADQEDVASELAARYGSAVELQVGFFGFPDRQSGRSRRARRPSTARPPLAEESFDGLELSVEVDRDVLHVGDSGSGQLVLRNTGSARIGPLSSGQPEVGALLDGSFERIGGYSGAIGGVGRTIDLGPGESASLPVIFGTACTRSDLGYVVPPGQYWLQVQMHISHGPGTEQTTTPAAPLKQITIIPRAADPRSALSAVVY